MVKVSVEVSFNLNDKPNKDGKYPHKIISLNGQSVSDLVIWATNTKEVETIATHIYNIGIDLKNGLIDKGEAIRLYNHYTK